MTGDKPQSIPVTYLQWPAIWKEKSEDVSTVNSGYWATPIYKYLQDGILPDDRNESRKIQRQAARFALFDGQLLKRSYSGPYLKCITPEEAQYVLAELHEGECGNHSEGRSLASRALTAGSYWPTMRADSASFTRRCDKCQRFSQVSHLPPEKLTPILSPWPFMKWGMDIVGKLPVAPGQRVYMLALTDYFSKWIEAEAFARIRDREVQSFVWKNIICRFGLPKEIVTDNGSQFISHRFQDFCRNWGIKLSFSTPRFPQANGQAESSNKTILNTMKKRLERSKGAWADELPGVLWSYRTTARSSTGETPFSLAFGTEAVIPAEGSVPSPRYQWIEDDSNHKLMSQNLDTIEEKRELVSVRLAAYQQKMARHFNKKVRCRSYKEGDWVLRKVFQNTKEVRDGKLGPTWDGPDLISKVFPHGAYRLRTETGEIIQNSWNVVHLKKYHR